MKHAFFTLLVATALLFALTFPLASPAAAPAEHPEIRDALAALRNAREHMAHASHDFGGHRDAALRATDNAIRELEICLKYDR